MEATVVHQAIVATLERLEHNLDLLITSSQPSTVGHALTQAVLGVSPHLLSSHEYAALLAGLRVLCAGYRLDDAQFQRHVGMSRSELGSLVQKLQPPAEQILRNGRARSAT
ncbi:MAG: hypothetical protein V4812_13280 [Pseudomonadota bacterium]